MGGCKEVEKLSKKMSLEERIAKLKKLQAEATEARVRLEKEAQEAQKEAETIIPVIKKELADIEAKIADLQTQRSEKIDTLKMLGIKIGKARGKGRGGGYKAKLQGLMRGVGVGATISNKDVQEYLGSVSGYVGMLIKEEIEAGNLQRTTAGVFKVTGMPT